ncbi:HNH endonuclease signature motif containing protein [Micromonospora sp. WP24]|uniref:HNH endonuclease signature motif containing protein n=1 Tax=Micromonospora sp. WP24 TaxID=2604469 RepID=UPI00165235E8|nr:HNH endonuclease signature motif containing protein [Micromonospora sp. WP24]
MDDAPGQALSGGHRLTLGKARVGQDKFRAELRQRFGDVCAITGPQPASAVEAAHLYRYCDTATHDVMGGLLLRRDLHALFDRFLLAVDPRTWTVRIAPSLAAYSDLAKLDGMPLAIPAALYRKAKYLKAHLGWAQDQRRLS